MDTAATAVPAGALACIVKNRQAETWGRGAVAAEAFKGHQAGSLT